MKQSCVCEREPMLFNSHTHCGPPPRQFCRVVFPRKGEVSGRGLIESIVTALEHTLSASLNRRTGASPHRRSRLCSSAPSLSAPYRRLRGSSGPSSSGGPSKSRRRSMASRNVSSSSSGCSPCRTPSPSVLRCARVKRTLTHLRSHC